MRTKRLTVDCTLDYYQSRECLEDLYGQDAIFAAWAIQMQSTHDVKKERVIEYLGHLFAWFC